MPETITTDSGGEREVYSTEEMEAAKEEAIIKFKEDNPDRTAELEESQTQLTKAQEDLEAAKKDLESADDKDRNFAALRNKVKDKEGEIETLNKSIDDKIDIAKKEILEGVSKDHYEDTIKKLVGDDKELLEKVELQYKRLADAATTKSEITKKLNDAFTLATGGTKESFDAGAFSSAGVGPVKIPRTKDKLGEEEKALARKLAKAGGMELEDKDFEDK